MPPFNIEAEQAALGAALIDRDAPLPPPADFYRLTHQHVAEAIHALRATGGADFLLVFNWLREQRRMEQITAAELDALTTVGCAAHAVHYAGIVMERAAERRCREAMRQFVKRNDDGEPLRSLLPDLMKSLLTENLGGRKPTQMHDALDALADDIDSGRHSERIHTGIAALDEMLQGFRTRQLIVMGGEPASGKSACALQISDHIAGSYGPGPIVSQEMRSDEVAERYAAQRLQRPIRQVTRDARSVRDVAAASRDVRMPIYDWQMTPDEFEAAMRDFKVQNPDMSFFTLDYLQIMRRATQHDRLKEHEFLGEVMPRLKRLCQELNVVGILLAQLTREARKGDGAPTMGAFRGGGVIEDNADKAFILWRSADGDLYANVCKNRQGPQGNVALHFDGPSVTFSSPGSAPVAPQRPQRGATRRADPIAFEDVPL